MFICIEKSNYFKYLIKIHNLSSYVLAQAEGLEPTIDHVAALPITYNPI